jgi:hypothetical protein
MKTKSEVEKLKENLINEGELRRESFNVFAQDVKELYSKVVLIERGFIVTENTLFYEVVEKYPLLYHVVKCAEKSIGKHYYDITLMDLASLREREVKRFRNVCKKKVLMLKELLAIVDLSLKK